MPIVTQTPCLPCWRPVLGDPKKARVPGKKTHGTRGHPLCFVLFSLQFVSFLPGIKGLSHG